MVTKYLLADQVLRILSGGDIQRDSNTQIREAMRIVAQARDMVVRQEVWSLMKQADDFDIPGEYITTFNNVEVKKDEDKDILYSVVPAQFINLPRNMGIYQVSLMKDQFNSFIPVRPSFRSMYNGLGGFCLEDRIGYWVEGNRIYYQGMVDSDDINKVCIKEIVSSSEIDDEDEAFPIPPDKEIDVINIALEIYGYQKQVKKDEINDSIDE